MTTQRAHDTRWEEDGPHTRKLRELSPVIDLIKARWDDLLACVTEQRRPSLAMRFHRLQENAARLVYRLDDFREAERQLDAEGAQGRYGEGHHYLQIRLVDRIEAFHQQVYQTISNLVMVPTFVGPEVMKRNYPIDSVQKFLTFLKENEFRYSSKTLEQIDILLRSVEFRARFVDHPQQHQLHDWMTHNNLGKTTAIYFQPDPSGVTAVLYMPDHRDPDDPNFRPAVDVGDNFYVAPSLQRTYDAFQAVSTALLRRVIEEHRKRSQEK